MAPEQVSALSDEELNRAMIWLYYLGFDISYNHHTNQYVDWTRVVDYLTDYNLTMPLAFKRGIAVIKDNQGTFWAGTDIQAGDGFAIYMDNDAEHENPLRAICECLVLIALDERDG